MKKLDYSFISSSAAQPIKQGTLKHVQEAFQEPIDYICRSIFGTTSGVNVLYGCVNTTEVGTTYTVSAGAVYYLGEVFLVDAVTATRAGNVLIASIATTYYTDATADPVTFTDLVAHNVHEIRKIVLALGTSGAGIADYVNFNSDRWHTVGSTFGELTEPAFQNSWASTGVGGHVVRFRKVGNRVELSGVFTTLGATTTVCFTLPSGFRPADSVGMATAILNSTTPLAGVTTVQTSGDVAVYYAAGATAVIFDGISFPLN